MTQKELLLEIKEFMEDTDCLEYRSVDAYIENVFYDNWTDLEIDEDVTYSQCVKIVREIFEEWEEQKFHEW